MSAETLVFRVGLSGAVYSRALVLRQNFFHSASTSRAVGLPILLNTCDGYRIIFPCPIAPPTEASKNAARLGHWSLPSSDTFFSPPLKNLPAFFSQLRIAIAGLGVCTEKGYL